MSTQRPDIIVFKDKKFVIIDIGKNQTLVSKEKILSNLENDYFYSSSCVRGYTAEFKINKNNPKAITIHNATEKPPILKSSLLSVSKILWNDSNVIVNISFFLL